MATGRRSDQQRGQGCPLGRQSGSAREAVMVLTGLARGFRRVEGRPVAGAPAALRMRVAWVRRYLTMVNDRRVGFEDPGWP